MGFNSVGTYNGKFMGNSSAKPICGICLTDMYKLSLNEGKVGTAGIAPGAPINIKTNAAAVAQAAGKGLNPNVLNITLATATTLDGFMLQNETDVLVDGSEAPIAQVGQIVKFAQLGSGAEVYLPVAADVADKAVKGPLYWHFTNGNITTTTPTASEAVVALPSSVQLISNVVDGIKVTYATGTGVASYASTKCARVRL